MVFSFLFFFFFIFILGQLPVLFEYNQEDMIANYDFPYPQPIKHRSTRIVPIPNLVEKSKGAQVNQVNCKERTVVSIK